jgi:hypothetical protein
MLNHDEHFKEAALAATVSIKHQVNILNMPPYAGQHKTSGQHLKFQIR